MGSRTPDRVWGRTHGVAQLVVDRFQRPYLQVLAREDDGHIVDVRVRVTFEDLDRLAEQLAAARTQWPPLTRWTPTDF